MIAEFLVKNGIEAGFSRECEQKMLAYMHIVLEENEKINLTAITAEEEFISRHIIDSLAVYDMSEMRKAKSICDVGTGVGFPGVPLAIVYPEKRFYLIDSLGKRVEVIKSACDLLAIENVEAQHIRAEDAGRDPALRETFDLALARAVSALPVLLEYTLPLIKPGGSLYAYKTLSALPEIESSGTALRLLGASPDVEVRRAPFSLESSGYRIFAVHKNKKTPSTYPRKAGVPGKVPL